MLFLVLVINLDIVATILMPLGILAREFMEKGGRLVGRWSIDGYEFDESIALENDEFLGLALDYDNQDSLSEKRINLWVNMIQSEFK